VYHEHNSTNVEAFIILGACLSIYFHLSSVAERGNMIHGPSMPASVMELNVLPCMLSYKINARKTIPSSCLAQTHSKWQGSRNTKGHQSLRHQEYKPANSLYVQKPTHIASLEEIVLKHH
jgi:hypothetical protein